MTDPAARPDPRKAIVEALMRLAAVQSFEDIRITDVCREAGVTLAQFREFFPSKGAVLGGFSRMIDLETLKRATGDLAGEGAKDRLFDVLMGRLDAMAPYKAGVQGVVVWARRDPAAALALNGVLVNSMRFMMEAADLDHDGLHGAMKLQGLVALWSGVLDVWFGDDDPGLARTMAELDKKLERGGKVAARLDDLHRFSAPFRTFLGAVMTPKSRTRPPRAADEDFSSSPDQNTRDDDAPAERPARMRGGWPNEGEVSSKFA
jgi:AcrR family transcriptional regulator